MLPAWGSKVALLFERGLSAPAWKELGSSHASSARAVASKALSDAAPAPKAFSKFSIYKGKGALQLGLIGPTWKATAKGGLALDREGVVYLEFANISADASQQASYGARAYAWDQKISFAMKATELGCFLDEKLATKGFDLYHDPDKGGQNEGAVKKTLAVKPNPDGQSFMFNMSLTDKAAGRTNVVLPVSSAEMAVIRNLVGFAIPRLLGFDMVCEGMHNVGATEAPGAA